MGNCFRSQENESATQTKNRQEDLDFTFASPNQVPQSNLLPTFAEPSFFSDKGSKNTPDQCAGKT